MGASRRAPSSATASASQPTTLQRPVLAVVEGRLLRLSRVRNAQARIAAGYYDRDDVRSRLADAVMRRMRRP